jgi:hypothetical protein
VVLWNSVVSVSNCDPHDRARPEEFECGLFVQSGTDFPSTPADFSSQRATERPFASQKFKIVTKDMSIHIHTSPETPPERILYPVIVNCPLALHDFLEPPKVTPQFELFLQLSPIKGEMNRLQYNYLSSVVSERLTLNPHKLIVAKSQTQEQKTERKEANDRGVTAAVVTAQLEPQRTPKSQELPLLACVYEKIECGCLELKDCKTSQENGNEVLAEIAFTNIAYVLENSSHATVTKVLLDNFTYLRCSTFKLNVPIFWFVASPSESEKTFNYWLLLKVPCHTVWFLRCGFIFTTFKFVGFTLHCPKYKTSSVLLNRTLPSP